MKTWKKIEETKKRAKEVNEVKQKNEEKVTLVSKYLIRCSKWNTFEVHKSEFRNSNRGCRT
jgi:predicted translin family RNA/ssDNA-binding protein